jgi:hypothetical protein
MKACKFESEVCTIPFGLNLAIGTLAEVVVGVALPGE